MVAPLEPLESAPERILILKVTLLLALTSLTKSEKKSWGLANSLCQRDVYGLRPGSGQGDLTA